MTNNHSFILKTVDKALKILELFSEQEREMSISEIAKRIGTNKSTVYRILNTLRSHAFVQQNSDNSKYKLGFKLLEISSVILERIELRHQARPSLERLRDKTNETVNLMIMEGGLGVYIDRVESTQRVRMVSVIGTREELHCTGVGKALLAFQSEKIVDEVIKKQGLLRKTSRTITDPHQLKQHFDEIKKRGYSIDDEEAEEGIRCIGAPIFNHKDKVVASISIAAPSYRLDEQKMKQFAPIVVETARKISQNLGKSTQKE